MKRTIRKGKTRANTDVQNVLESLFVAESLDGSSELWIVSPWLSDVNIVNNCGGRFAHLSSVGIGQIRISTVLVFLAQTFETRTTIVTSDHEWARESKRVFPRAFALGGVSDFLTMIIKPQHLLHEKSIATSDWHISGSMNFTKQGINQRDEHIEIETDRALVAEVIIDLRRRYPWSPGLTE